MFWKSSTQVSIEPRWMESLSEHLEPVLEEGRRVSSNREQLHSSYNNWLKVNEDAIESITKIRDEIIVTNRRDNYINVGGTAGGILGSTLGIIGALTAIPTGGASLVLMGGAVTAGSVAVSVGSNVKRNSKNKKLCEMAVENFEKNRKNTILFESQCKAYFEALEKFTSFFNTISGNDVALSLFYEFADEENFEFLNDLKLDRWSRNQVRSVLKEIIESDVTKLAPHMLSEKSIGNQSRRLHNLVQNIRMKLDNLRNIIINDPYLSQIFRNRIRDFLVKRLKDFPQINLRRSIKSLLILTVGKPITSFTTISYLNIKSSLNKMSDAVRVGLVALNAVFVVIGIVGLLKTLVSLENGSQSNETKSITEAVNNLKQARKEIVKKMGKNFGW